MRRVLGFLLPAIVLASCSTESYSTAEGTETGPCFSNGTCNVGLVCASNRCVRVDADAGAGEDSGSSGDAQVADTGTDVASDAVSGCMAPEQPQGKRCQADADASSFKCTGTQRCCVGEGACQDSSMFCAGDIYIECLSRDDCEGAERCCLEGIVGNDKVCPRLISGFGRARCNTSCIAGEIETCTVLGATSCGAGQRCEGANVPVQYGNQTAVNLFVGVCR